MKEISKIERAVPATPQRKRVAAYARVSMESERLMRSLSAQVSYYSAYIQKNPYWIYAGVYADDYVIIGISGKKPIKSRVLGTCPCYFFLQAQGIFH